MSHRREIWREKRIAECQKDGQEYAKGELTRGDVVDFKEFGDETSVVVADDRGRFDVLDVSSDHTADLERGDSVRVSRVGETSLEVREAREQGRER